MENSAAVPQIEYEVTMADGRVLSWCAPSVEDLFKRVIAKGYEPVYVKLYEAYTPDMEAREHQEAYVFELNQAIEEAKTA